MRKNYSDLFEANDDTTILFGDGAITQFAYLLEVNSFKTIAAFTGASSADKCGAWSSILLGAGYLDINLERYKDIEPEPSMQTVEKMIEFLKKVKPEAVIAVGGGSVMDAAKAAYASYQTGMPLADLFGVNKIAEKFPGRTLKKVICFPTSAGTGSEATPYSNIVDKEANVKKLIVDRQIIPENSFVCPEFTVSMSKELTLVTACDALTHAIEGYLNINVKNELADDCALEAIRLILGNLKQAIEEPENYICREKISAAATLAGMVIKDKPTSLPHLVSFSWFGLIPHGLAVAIVLPHAWKYYLNSEAVKERTLSLKSLFGVKDARKAEAVPDALIKFLKELGVECSLSKYEGFSKSLLEETAKSASKNNVKLETAPLPVPADKSYDVLIKILDSASK